MKKEIKIEGALNQGHLDTLTNLAKFIGADLINYKEIGEGTEVHLIGKKGKVLKITTGCWGKDVYTNFNVI